MKSFITIVFLAVALTGMTQNMNLRINEIIASNQAGEMDDFFEYDDWVEIYNPPGSGITNLAGYYISDDPDSLDKWQIPADDAGITTVLPNNFIVFWIDDDYGNTTPQGADHNAGFTLSVDGETFLLTAPDGVTIIDSVSYPVMASDISWGRTCDGCDTWQYFNNVTFDDNNVEILNNDLLFINEVQTDNATTYDDPEHEFDQWFEIYNPNAHQVNLANYYLSVNGDLQQWQVPASSPYRTVIPAGGFTLIWCDNDLADDVNHAPFFLDNTGGTIVLTGPDGITNIDSYTYSTIATDHSYGRQSDGSATSIDFSIPTPTVSNSLIIIEPQNILINEILTANQTDTIDNLNEFEDWIELYNPNNFDINVGGYYMSDDPLVRNKWKIPTDFPDSVIVPAHGWLLFWADADQQQGVRHAGFRLSNNGEYLSLVGQDGFTLADELEWGYIAPDTSLGRITDGSETWFLFVGTTPEYSNNAGTIQVVESTTTTFEVYPNPAQDIIRFNEMLNVQVFNIAGKLVMAENKVQQLNLANLETGMYLLRDDQGRIVRIMKQ
ncbi:MAG: lamin tail domain-containing protein [Flavobacteriales bacterium]|nr:lamin tail domain-containing protein [Flavobacteriales bacterium]